MPVGATFTGAFSPADRSVLQQPASRAAKRTMRGAVVRGMHQVLIAGERIWLAECCDHVSALAGFLVLPRKPSRLQPSRAACAAAGFAAHGRA
jgi:hypothetical protein